LSKLPPQSENVVFSHNDFHHRNFLEKTKDETIITIDYEYGDYNYRAYDIANLFNEMMIDYDKEGLPGYSIEGENYPVVTDIIDFLNYYVFFCKLDKLYIDENKFYDDDSMLKMLIKKHWNIEEFNKEVQKLFGEVLVCRLLSHFYWIIWSVVKSKDKRTEFDFLDYAYARYQIYQSFKDENCQVQFIDIKPLLLKD